MVILGPRKSKNHDPVAEHARDRAGGGVLGRKIQVFHYYIIIIIGKATDVNAGLGSRGLRDRNAS